MELIDSHVHLLYPEKFSYAWCAAQPTLNRAYRLEEYRAAATAAPAGVTVRSLVYLEADVPVTQQEAEADFFGQLARTDRGRPPVAAVIAAAWPESEAFAVQLVATMNELQLSADRINVHGGAVALGHPIGASGARVMATLLNALERRGQQRGVAALCLGGGNAIAMAVERV